MPKYQVSFPNGKTYEVESPTGMTNEQAYNAVMNHLSGTPQPPAGRGGVLPSFAEAFVTGITDIPAGIADLYGALGMLEKPEESLAYKFSKGAEKVTQDILGINPEAEPTSAETGAQALGSVASFFVPYLGAAKVAKGLGVAGKGAQLAGNIASGIQAGALGAEQQAESIRAQEAQGKVVPGANKSAAIVAGSLIGLTDLIPLEKYLGPLEHVLSRVPLAKAGETAELLQKSLPGIIKSATVEGAQEGVSQLAQNIVEKGLYNPDLDLTEGLLGNTAAGGFAGGTIGAILELTAGRKIANFDRKQRQLFKSQQEEARAKAPQQIRGEAISGINEIRAAAPSGEIKITSDTDENGVSDFVVRDAANRPIARFSSVEAATIAARQYEQESGGLAKLTAPTLADAGKNPVVQPTAEEKKKGKKLAKVLKAEGTLNPAPVQAPAAPEAQAATIQSVTNAAAQTPATPAEAATLANPSSPAKPITPKGRKRIAPVGVPVQETIAAPPVSTTAAEIPAPVTPVSRDMEFGTADERAAIRREIAPQAETFKDMTPEQQAAYAAELDRRYPGRTYSIPPVETPAAPQAIPAAQTPSVRPSEAPPAAVPQAPAPTQVTPTEKPLAALFVPNTSTTEGIQKLEQFKARRAEIANELNKRLAPIAGKGVRVNLVDAVLAIDKQGRLRVGEGEVNPAGDIISLSYNIYDPNLSVEEHVDKIFDVMNHEVIHSLVNMGKLNQQEIRTLFEAAQRTKYGKNSFTYFDRAYAMYQDIPNYTPEMILEEAVAEMFRDARAGRLDLTGKPKGIFQSVVEFFRRLFSSYDKAGMAKIFKDIESGKVGAREARAIEGGVGKFSIPAQLTGESEKEFARWWGEGKHTLETADGTPVPVYTGTSKDKIFESFQEKDRGIWVTTNPNFASDFALDNESMKSGQGRDLKSRVIPLYARIKNPLDLSTKEKESEFYRAKNIRFSDSPDGYKKMQAQAGRYARSMGHDSIEWSPGVYAIFNAKDLKSTFNRFEPGAAESRKFSITPEDFKNSEWGRIFAGPENEKILNEAQNPKSRTTIVAMSPDDFIAAATYGLRNKGQERVYAENVGRGMTLRQIPYLAIATDKDGTLHVVSHDGRHRVLALKELGTELIPVQIRHETYRWGEMGNPPLPETMVGQGPLEKVVNTPDSIFFPRKDGAEKGRQLMSQPAFGSRVSVGLAPDQEVIKRGAKEFTLNRLRKYGEAWFKENEPTIMQNLDKHMESDIHGLNVQFSKEIADVAMEAGASRAYASNAIGVFGNEAAEPSSAFEAIMPAEKEMNVANATLIKTFELAKTHNQRSAFVSRLLPNAEQNAPYARPGLTLFFYPVGDGRTRRTEQEIREIISSLPRSEFLGGFTAFESEVIEFGDGRGEFQGIRFVWIPEYAGVDVKGLADNWESVVEALDEIAIHAEKTGIGSAKIEHYDVAIGYEDTYDGQIAAAQQLRAERNAGGFGAQGPWRRPVSESVASRLGISESELAGYRDRGDLERGKRKFSIAAQETGLNEQEFARWFKQSVAVNPDGTPMRYYRGDPRPLEGGELRTMPIMSGGLRGEQGPFFFSPAPTFASDFAIHDLSAMGTGRDPGSGVMTPVYLSVQNPWDYKNPNDIDRLVNYITDAVDGGKGVEYTAARNWWDAKTVQKLEAGNWKTIERPAVQRAIRDLGYDGFYLIENGSRNLAIYNPSQAKSIFNRFEPGTAESRKLSISPEIRTAEGVAKNVARTGEATQAEVDIANQSVEQAVRKISVVPKEVPMPPGMDAADEKIFATAYIPSSPGVRIMEIFGGFGSAAGRTGLMDRFRVEFVQQEGQIEKYERAELIKDIAKRWRAGVAEYSAIAALDQHKRHTHLTLASLYSGAIKVMALDKNMRAVAASDPSADPDSLYLDVSDDPDNALFKVMEMVMTGGPNGDSLFKQFRAYAIAQVSKRRISEGKKVPSNVTAQYIAEADNFGVQYPIIAEAFTRYQTFNTQMIQAAADAGAIPQSLVNELTDDQNYFSMYRELGDGAEVPVAGGGVAKIPRFKEYRGSVEGNVMADPFEAIVHNVMFWTNLTSRTIASRKAYELGKRMGIVRQLKTYTDPNTGNLVKEQPDTQKGEDPRVLNTRINGNDVRFATTDPLFATGLMSTDYSSLNNALKYLGMPADILRESVTRDPGFMIANLLRDSVSTWSIGSSGANPAATFKGLLSAASRSDTFKRMYRFGTIGSFAEAQKSPRQIVQSMKKKIIPTDDLLSLTGAVKAGWDKLELASEASDAATRIAVYEDAIKNGATEFTAAYRALSIMNFSRSGHSSLIRGLTKVIPFLNARIQGFDVLYRGLKTGVMTATGQEQLETERTQGTRVLYRAAGLAAASLLLHAMQSDDDEYKNIPRYIKDSNTVVGIGGGKFITIPKPFEAGFLFMTVPTTMYDVVTGDRSSRSAMKLFAQQFGSTFGFNPFPQFAAPIIENYINVDLFTGQPLISPGIEKLDPSLQYNASTSYVARGLSELSKYTPFGYSFESGRFEGISPIKIDNLITGYGGPIGSYISMALGGLTYAFGSDNQGLPVPASKLPVIRRFFIDAQDLQPQAAADAYELYQVVDSATRTMARLRKSRDFEAMREFRAENIDLLRAGPKVRKMTENLSNIRAQMRRLEADKTMSYDQKLEKMRELRAREARVTRSIADLNRQLGR